MASEFLNDLATDLNLSAIERAILSQAGVRSAEEVDSLLTAFPSLGMPPGGAPALPVARLSNTVAQRLGASYAMARSAMAATAPPPVRFGALPPPRSVMTPGSRVGLPPLALPPIGASPTSGGSVDLRLANWHVRNQGDRGTCVAFATAACFEHFQAQVPSGALSDRAEQFLYWVIKTSTQDPIPTQHGTWLRFARDGLISHGLCREALQPYHPVPDSMIAGLAPGVPALQDGMANRHASATQISNPNGAAARVLGTLRQGHVAAVSLPVFKDPLTPPGGPTNWTTGAGWAYGRVLDPPTHAVVDGGHCVCVVGYVPDSAEESGGYFIIRNSWGTAWGNQNPLPNVSLAPEQGYGVVSATYVDQYCWELFHM